MIKKGQYLKTLNFSFDRFCKSGQAREFSKQDIPSVILHQAILFRFVFALSIIQNEYNQRRSIYISKSFI